MRRRTRWLAGAGMAVGLMAIGGAGIAVATGDDDRPLTGGDEERAVAAALEHTGGGTVTETEVGDDGAAFGVEVRLPDGRQVEVELDADFNVIGQAADDDGASGEGRGDD